MNEYNMSPETSPTKVCKSCQQDLLRSEFYRTKNNKDGLYGHCKKCHRQLTKAWEQAHPEHKRKLAQQWRDQHREQERERHRECYAANPEKHRAAVKASHYKHREKRLAYAKEYDRTHKEQAAKWARERLRADPYPEREDVLRRRLLKKGIAAEKVDYNAIVQRDGYICYLCGGLVDPTELEFDHVIPLCKGGPHTAENIKVTHAVCNRTKNVHLVTM